MDVVVGQDAVVVTATSTETETGVELVMRPLTGMRSAVQALTANFTLRTGIDGLKREAPNGKYNMQLPVTIHVIADFQQTCTLLTADICTKFYSEYHTQVPCPSESAALRQSVGRA
jgi:hypothetical protein